MNVTAERLNRVRSRLQKACERSGRAVDTVRLLAVSKWQPAEAIRSLHALGQRAFGENRLQEALTKQAELGGLPLEWHFIGPVQSNKTRDIAAHFDWVQSVDREKILTRLNAHRPKHLPPLQICLQVNIDREPQKAGIDPDAVRALALAARECPALQLRGLMCIPAQSDDPRVTRASFLRLAAIADDLASDGFELDTLSMGMSGDLETAVDAGSTMVRVGTDLFGPRPASAAGHHAEARGAKAS